jgi:hypothetical protein
MSPPSPSSASTWLSRLLGIAIMGAAVVATVAFPVQGYAQDDDEEDEDEGDDDDDGDDTEEEEEEEEDKDQPPVTAGGLFTLKTYPTSEVLRPLTMTEKITQARVGVGFDISNARAFETFGLLLDVQHGYRDHVELQGGFKGINNFKNIDAYVGAEMALAYDLINFRAAGRITYVKDVDTIPAIDIGFPFRYVAKPEIAITALETFFAMPLNGDKPTFLPSIGIITNPHPLVAIILRAQLIVPNFDFSQDKSFYQVRATATVQFTATQVIDMGAEFTFEDMLPPEGVKFYDERFLIFYGQLRFGR